MRDIIAAKMAASISSKPLIQTLMLNSHPQPTPQTTKKPAASFEKSTSDSCPPSPPSMPLHSLTALTSQTYVVTNH